MEPVSVSYTHLDVYKRQDKALVLEQIQRRVDHPRAGAVVPLGEGFDLFDQLIAVAGAATEDVQNNQPQFAVAKETLATSAAAAAMFAVFAGIAVAPAWPTPCLLYTSLVGYLQQGLQMVGIPNQVSSALSGALLVVVVMGRSLSLHREWVRATWRRLFSHKTIGA